MDQDLPIVLVYVGLLVFLGLLARPPRTWFCKHEPGEWEHGFTEEWRCCTKCGLLLEERR